MIRDELDRLSNAITASLRDDPDNFDAREPLWMQREDLRALAALQPVLPPPLEVSV